jgi:double-strand break repair protein MRE11
MCSPPDAHTFRLMISTDNHLGYMELDPVRGEDSFNSFREMLEQARANQVDFVLLGGDLFHENKPSRQTLCKTVNILRQFTFGENPITFEIISDQAKNFPTTSVECVEQLQIPTDLAVSSRFLVDVVTRCSKHCNYEDPNFNVALPIFSIHGNHDDPSGAGAYSTMDLLHR